MNKVGWIVTSLLVSGAVVAEPFSNSEKRTRMDYGWASGYSTNSGKFLSGSSNTENVVSAVMEYKESHFQPVFLFSHPLPCHNRTDADDKPIFDKREFRIDGKSYPAVKECFKTKAYKGYPASYGSELTPTTQAGYDAIYRAFKNNEYVTVDFIYDKAVFWSYGLDVISEKLQRESQQQ